MYCVHFLHGGFSMASFKKSKPTQFSTPAAAPAKVPTPAVTPAAPAASVRSEFKGSGTKAPMAAARSITSEDIARRAFEIYASRGYAAGDQNADWYEAERQLRAGL
jgi:hypothetical protein